MTGVGQPAKALGLFAVSPESLAGLVGRLI